MLLPNLHSHFVVSVVDVDVLLKQLVCPPKQESRNITKRTTTLFLGCAGNVGFSHQAKILSDLDILLSSW